MCCHAASPSGLGRGGCIEISAPPLVPTDSAQVGVHKSTRFKHHHDLQREIKLSTQTQYWQKEAHIDTVVAKQGFKVFQCTAKSQWTGKGLRLWHCKVQGQVWQLMHHIEMPKLHACLIFAMPASLYIPVQAGSSCTMCRTFVSTKHASAGTPAYMVRSHPVAHLSKALCTGSNAL